MTAPTASPQAVAAALAARIAHDVAGHASGIISGLELCAEAEDESLRREGLGLAASSAQGLQDLLGFCRIAFAGTIEPQSGAALETLARIPFEGRRADLEWSARLEEFEPLTARASLILAQIAAAGLPRGGCARLSVARSQDQVTVRVDGEGPRVALQPEALEGLAGLQLSSGLAGRWAPAYLLHLALSEVGGELSAVTGESSFMLQARIPTAA